MKYNSILCIAFVAIIAIHEPVQAHFEQVVDSFGFIYNADQDIYVSKMDAFQRIFGYHKLFDFFAPLGGMVIDAEPVIFFYDGMRYMMEMWKGQYFASSGAELGFYQWNGVGWDAVKDQDMLFMSYTLKKNDTLLLERQGIHWWLAGFFPGVFSETWDLVLEDIYIEFKTTAMRDSFYDALIAMGYDDEHDDIRVPAGSNTITFNYTDPKSEQNGSPPSRQYVQIQNRVAVTKFNNRKKEVHGIDNSPATMDRMFVPHEVLTIKEGG